MGCDTASLDAMLTSALGPIQMLYMIKHTHSRQSVQHLVCSLIQIVKKVAYHLLPLNTSPSGRFLILMSAEGRDSLFILPAIGTIILHRLVALWLQSIIRHWERLISTPPIFPCHHLWVIKLGSPARLTERLPMDKNGKKKKMGKQGHQSLARIGTCTTTYTDIYIYHNKLSLMACLSVFDCPFLPLKKVFVSLILV